MRRVEKSIATRLNMRSCDMPSSKAGRLASCRRWKAGESAKARKVLLSCNPLMAMVEAMIRSALNYLGADLSTGPFDIFTWYGVIFLYVIHGVPFAYLILAAGLRNLDTQLEEQSWMCGVSPGRTLFTVIFPAMAPSALGALLLVVWSGFGMYALPQAIAASADIDIMSVSIVKFLHGEYPPREGEIGRAHV